MAGAVLPLSWGRASVLYSVQRFCMLSGGAPFVARLRFMFLLGFPLPHYPFLWPLPLFLFYISIQEAMLLRLFLCNGPIDTWPLLFTSK